MAGVSAYAYKPQGAFSVFPRVGLNLSTLSDASLWASASQEIKPRRRPDLMIGVDAEWSALAREKVGLGVMLGVFYSRQGCHYPDYIEDLPIAKPGETQAMDYDTNNIMLDYINVPLTANLYVTDYLFFRAGVQCGFNVGGKWKYESTLVTTAKDGTTTYGETMKTSYDMKWMLNKVVWSIPIAVGVEFGNVQLEVRYNIPLTRYCKDVMVEDELYSLSKGSNRVLSFSVGYRF